MPKVIVIEVNPRYCVFVFYSFNYSAITQVTYELYLKIGRVMLSDQSLATADSRKWLTLRVDFVICYPMFYVNVN